MVKRWPSVVGLAKSLARRKCPRLVMLYRYYRSTRVLLDKPTETPLGFRLSGNRLMETGRFEVEETVLVRKILEEVDLLINVGANVGYYCCLALQADKRVAAFEPLGSNLDLLCRNIEANNWQDRIEIIPCAVSDHIGIETIYGAGTGASLLKGWAGQSDTPAGLVPTTTLDRVLAGQVQGTRCLVLVDVEGAELGVLRGADRLLQNSPKPLWMVEISTSEHQPAGRTVNPDLLATFELFWARGYRSYTADSRMREVTRTEIEGLANGQRDSLGTHNFLFVHAERPFALTGTWQVGTGLRSFTSDTFDPLRSLSWSLPGSGGRAMHPPLKW